MKYSIEKFFLYSFWKIIFWLVIFGPSSQAQSTNCRDAFSSPRSPLALAEAMSKNLLLRKNQSALLEGYVKSFFNAKETEYKNEIQDLFNILKDYPELSKPALREYQMVFFHKEQTKTESLTHFLKSFNSSAGRIKNNLFQIEANWGFWAKALSSAESKNNSASLSNAEKKELKEKEKQQFLEYLETTPLNKKFRQFIASSKNSEENFSAYSEENLESPVLDYREKTIAFYQALSTLRENFQDNPKAFEFLSQAMSDVIHVSGFNNEFYSELLKSKIPSENIKGAYNILLERDSLAKELDFKEGFTELQSSLNIKHKDNFSEQLNAIEEEINNSSSAVRKEVLRLRPLSLQEAPFRGCLGNDCSTNQYFDLALDPNYLYFTLTNKEHQSFAQVTVVLGQARDKNNKSVKVAFVDKIQDVPNQKITAVLEAIRLSLKEEGYKLALPENTGDFNGLSDETKTRIFIENEVLPDLKIELWEFAPLKHKYYFETGFSRAGDKLSLWEFDSYKKKKSIEIQPGEKNLPKKANGNLSFKILYQPILAMKNSKKEEEQILFLKHLLMMNSLKSLKVSNKQVEDHLLSVIQNPNMSLKLRKVAFFTLIQFKQSQLQLALELLDKLPSYYKHLEVLDYLENQLKNFSKKEQALILGEMSNWKNSKESYKRGFISDLHFFALNEGLKALETLAHKSSWKVLFDVNSINIKREQTMLQLANHRDEKIEIVQWLIKNGADLENRDRLYENTPLMNAVIWNRPNIIKKLIEAGADLNAVNADGDTPLMLAIIYGHPQIAQELIRAGADINVRNKNGANALMFTARTGLSNITKMLIDKGADINAQGEYGISALMSAISFGNLYIVQLLIRAKANLNARDEYGETALMFAVRYEYPQITKELIRAGADLNIKNKDGETVLSLAKKYKILEIEKIIIDELK